MFMAGEGRFQNKVLSDLRSYKKYITVFKIMKTSDNGVPDVFFTTKATGPIFLELKDKGKEPRENQILMIEKLNKTGVKSVWCDSWEEWVKIKKLINLSKKSVIF